MSGEEGNIFPSNREERCSDRDSATNLESSEKTGRERMDCITVKRTLDFWSYLTVGNVSSLYLEQVQKLQSLNTFQINLKHLLKQIN